MQAALIAGHMLALFVGLSLVARVMISAVQTFVLPRGVSERLSRAVFISTRALFDLRSSKLSSYEERDRVMALYGPISLLTLLLVWLILVLVGFTLIFMAVGEPLPTAIKVSGSSLLTLGFATGRSVPEAFLTFAEAGLGLLLAALLVAYLPTIYTAWQRREALVALLETRAGSPPSAWELIIRFYRIRGLAATSQLWPVWEQWFIEIEESQTSLSALTFFRSPQQDRSWVAAAGVILDAASLLTSTVDVPRDPDRELCLRTGYLALRRIAALFRIPFNPDPGPENQISITRREFDEVCDQLASEGIPLKPDRDLAWRDFVGWRVNYDDTLLALASLTMASYAPWISDRSSRRWSRTSFGFPVARSESVAPRQAPE